MFFVPSRPTGMGLDFAVKMPDEADRFRTFYRIIALADRDSIWNDLRACGVVIASGPTLVPE